MTVRDSILNRIRTLQGRSGDTSPQEMQAVHERIAERDIGPQPAMPWETLTRFKDECERLTTTFAEVGAISDVPREAARYIAANRLKPQMVGWHAYASLDWADAGIGYDDRPANGNDLIGFTGCFCAIAETGTLLLLSSPTTPKATALLPETHICVVEKSRIVRTMEESFALMRQEVSELPRSTFFVSGPSRTADIEQTIVLGAHGPYRVHVVLVP